MHHLGVKWLAALEGLTGTALPRLRIQEQEVHPTGSPTTPSLGLATWIGSALDCMSLVCSQLCFSSMPTVVCETVTRVLHCMSSGALKLYHHSLVY